MNAAAVDRDAAAVVAAGVSNDQSMNTDAVGPDDLCPYQWMHSHHQHHHHQQQQQHVQHLMNSVESGGAAVLARYY